MEKILIAKIIKSLRKKAQNKFFKSEKQAMEYKPQQEMKTQINEIKRMQQLAGIINENQINEEDSNILDLINDYKGNAYALDQGYGFNVDEMEAEQESIKQQIIDLKGEQYFELVNDIADLTVYLDEYAGPDESKEIEGNIKVITNKMGLTPNDLEYLLLDFDDEE